MDVISLGAGVQSSTLLLMADQGLIEIDGEVIVPKYAIMSDTGNEPKKVYEWLKFLQSKVKNIEIIITDNGNIVNDILNGIKNNERFASVPFYTKKKVLIYRQIPVGTKKVFDEDLNEEVEEVIYKQGELLGSKWEKGLLWRQCTNEYKIKAVRKKIRSLLGYGPREKVKEQTRLWMGISTDEIQRVKPSQVNFIKNVFPLIDYDMSRLDCLSWFEKEKMPLPPKSSCIICPYHSNVHWKYMKKEDQESWEMAVAFDKAIRHMPKLDAEVYLHRSCVPLDEVDFGADQLEIDDFINECEGMCGI